MNILKDIIRECLNEKMEDSSKAFDLIKSRYSNKIIHDIRAVSDKMVKEHPSTSFIKNKGISINVRILDIYNPVVEESDGTLVLPIKGEVNGKVKNLYICSDDLENSVDSTVFPHDLEKNRGTSVMGRGTPMRQQPVFGGNTQK